MVADLRPAASHAAGRFHLRWAIEPLLATYLISTLILAATPGATTAVVVRNTLARGRRGGFSAVAGAATGNTIQAVIAAAGAAVLFTRWPLIAKVLGVAGGFYLLWLGAVSLRKAWRNSSRLNIPGPGEADRGYSTGKGFRQGLTVNLLNPAITSFYVAVLPAFIPAAAPSWYFAFLAAAHVVIAFACHSAWTVVVGWLMQRNKEGGQQRWVRAMDAATGLVLIALAIQVMASA